MILEIDNKFYISKSGTCSDNCVFFENKQNECAPYRFTRCVDEKGSCMWVNLTEKNTPITLPVKEKITFILFQKGADRLAKIEVLEELLESINTPCVEKYASSYEEGIRDKRNDDVETIEARILELKENN